MVEDQGSYFWSWSKGITFFEWSLWMSEEMQYLYTWTICYFSIVDEMSDLKGQIRLLEEKNTSYMQTNMELEEVSSTEI